LRGKRQDPAILPKQEELWLTLADVGNQSPRGGRAREIEDRRAVAFQADPDQPCASELAAKLLLERRRGIGGALARPSNGNPRPSARHAETKQRSCAAQAKLEEAERRLGREHLLHPRSRQSRRKLFDNLGQLCGAQ